MKGLCFLMFFGLFAATASSQDWTLKDSGIGLIIEDTINVRPFKIIRRGTIWNTKDLIEKGAMEGKFNGNQLFAAWIQGPETKEFKTAKGKPLWMCRYRIIYPDGKSYDSAPVDFLSSGISHFAFNPGDYKEGVWKIEWFIHNRVTGQSGHVATTVFQTTW